MDSVLIAVDDSKGSLRVIEVFRELFADRLPEKVVLVHVEKVEGRSLMDDMLGEAELSTLKEELKGTRYQQLLDQKAEKILAYFKELLEEQKVTGVETVVREGHPAEEILTAAREAGARLIMVGSRAGRLRSLLMGSVSREVADRAEVPVLIAR